MGAFFVINMIESNVATPMLLGRRMPLNPVAIFLGLLFWGWVWGITGAVLAVPLTVLVKVVSDRVDGLKSFGQLLDNYRRLARRAAHCRQAKSGVESRPLAP